MKRNMKECIEKIMGKKAMIWMVLFMLLFMAVPSSKVQVQAKSTGLSKKVYKQIKGVYHSGYYGSTKWNRVKVTKKYITYHNIYDLKKLNKKTMFYKFKILSCKKTSYGYKIKVKCLYNRYDPYDFRTGKKYIFKYYKRNKSASQAYVDVSREAPINRYNCFYR